MTKSFAKQRSVVILLILISLQASLITASSTETPKRIISAAPNITEILFELGVDDRLVGVSSFCDYPEAAKQKAKIGGFSNPSLEAVVALRPDLVLLTHDGNPKAFEEKLRSMNIHTLVIQARKISDLPQSIRQIGAEVGSKDKAERLAVDIEKRLHDYRAKEQLAGAHEKSPKKKVLFIIWPDPLIVAGPGTTTNEALALLGMENIAANTLTAYPKYSIEEILRRAPDVIFIGKGNGMDKVADGLLRRLNTVPAVRNGKVFYVSDYLYRLGPRTLNGVDELAAHLKKP